MNIKLLASALGSIVASVPEKKASLWTVDETPAVNLDLQNMVGDAHDEAISTFTQFSPNPGKNLMANPLSPIQGDEIFFNYLIPGAKFQSHDGQQWLIEDYNWNGQIQITNVWYPRINAVVSVYDVRRSIHSYVEPVQVTIPPPPPGINYSAQPVQVMK